MRRALLFDLDETLMVEEPAAAADFEATAATAASRHDISPEALALEARKRARELWYAAPTHEYCKRVGISSWEGLWWCQFEGEVDEIRALRAWSPAYRRDTWLTALADQGIEDSGFSEMLAEQFGKERRARHQVFVDAGIALSGFGAEYVLAVVTNGASCLQREKLRASGLSGQFEAVVVSADLGIAKPHSAVFDHVLSLLGIESHHAVMIGDSLPRDVLGARSAGLKAIWVNPDEGSSPPAHQDITQVAALTDLPRALEELACD